jgi:hypothetical protein
VKVYIASHKHEAGRALRNLVLSLGHQVTSRWLEGAPYTGLPLTEEGKLRAAVEKLEDFRAADILLLRAEIDRSYVPGHKHVETSAAIAWGKPVLVLFRYENLFN